MRGERKAFRSLIVAAALMGAANVGFSQAPGDPREAIARLGSFPGEVEKITTAISRTSLPDGASILMKTHVTGMQVLEKSQERCRFRELQKGEPERFFYAFQHWVNLEKGWVNLENGKLPVAIPDFATKYPEAISFPDLNASLQSRIQVVQTSNRQFADRFTPMLRHWAETSLPQSSAAFNSASAEVLAVQDEGTNESQRTRVIAALDRILASLGSGKGELTAMADVLSGYLQGQRAARGSLSGWSTAAAGQVQSRAEEISREMKKAGCPGDYQVRVDTIVRNANASIATITTNIGELQKRDNEADTALSIVLGTFVGYASRYEAVADRLKVAKEAPLGSTIQDLHLSIAAGMWQDLVESAKKSGL